MVPNTNRGFPGGSVVKILPAKQKLWVQSLGQKGPLEKEVATHSSILTWEVPWTENLGGLQYMRSQRMGHDLETTQQNRYKVLAVDPKKVLISTPKPCTYKQQ